MRLAGRLRQHAGALLAGLAVGGLFALTLLSASYESLRERTFDRLMHWGPAVASEPVVIVDIDREAVAAGGGWPWGRERLARLIAQVAAGNPKALGIDVLIEGNDRHSPAANLARFARENRRADLETLAQSLPDGDADLAAALERAPSVLGLALDPRARSEDIPLRPISVGGRFDAQPLWVERSLAAPAAEMLDAAAGAGLLSLAADGDGVTRRVPLLGVAGRTLVPGLAVDMLRVASGAPLLGLQGPERRLIVGGHGLPLGQDGQLRLSPRAFGQAERIGAEHVLTGEESARLAGRIVLIGASAPEAGGLRPSLAGLLPSVYLQAAALSQMTAGLVPLRPALALRFETALLALAVLSGAALGAAFSPRRAWLAIGLAAALFAIGPALWFFRQVLFDSLAAPAGLAIAFLTATAVSAAATRRREARIRARFEQHLSPEVVARLMRAPEGLKLEGEFREITALFTDVEGFTAMVSRAPPRELIRLLDRYFDGMSAIIVEHGGMIDKIVGDAVHAIFNAPFDLADHPARAFACARALLDFAETFRQEGAAERLGFGRTRIGLETGRVIVGDVGGRRKLDYTAHGDAMNAAAKLEAANKQLGSTMAIGPGLAHRLAEPLRALGDYALPGQPRAAPVYTIWPKDIDRARRETESALMAAIVAGDPAAPAKLAAFAAAHPDDRVLEALARRFSA